jgi:perosamine synthetase
LDREITLSAPDITQREIDAVVNVLRSPHLSLGPKVPEFEGQFTARCGVRHAIACNSGTSGLHLVWKSIGIGPGDEVITTPFSFIASSNSILFNGAKCVFVDIDPHTWQIDAGRIEAAITPKTKALMPVDVFGSCADMQAIGAIAEKHDLWVVEDSCEALGSTYRGRPMGALGDAGVFGFYPNKQLTTGEGGMIVTNDDDVARLCRSYRNQGRDSDAGWLAHARLGYNFRLPDINCAIGVEQMKRLDEIIAKRKRVYGWYQEALADESRVYMQQVLPEVDLHPFVCVVRLADRYTREDRDRILQQLRDKKIGCNNYFTPIHLQPFYREQFGYKPGDFPITEHVSARTIALPFHNHLSKQDIEYVVGYFRSLL